MQLDNLKHAAWDRAKSRPWNPIYIRHEQRPGWSAQLPIYVIWCDDCQKWSEMNPQGYSGRIHCRGCKNYVALNATPAFKQAFFMVSMAAFPRLTIGAVRLYTRLFYGKPSELPASVDATDSTANDAKVQTDERKSEDDQRKFN